MKYISNKKTEENIYGNIWRAALLIDSSLRRTADGYEQIMRRMGKYRRKARYTDSKRRGVLQADAVRPKGNDGKDGTGNLSDSRERRGYVH